MCALSSLAWATKCATPSTIARARWAALVAVLNPRTAPRACGAITGLRIPVMLGGKVTPPAFSTVAAIAVICSGDSNQPNRSQAQLSADPVAAANVSRVYVDRPSARQPVSTRVPSGADSAAGQLLPVHRSTKLPVPCTTIASPAWVQPSPTRAAC